MKLKLFGFKIFITVFIVIISFLHGYSQSCGLGFYSHDVVQDKRTGLILNPGNALQPKDNFSISFDFSFIPNQKSYFGYILRLVNENNQHIDFVYDDQGHNRHFKIIVGERLTQIDFDIPDKALYAKWNNIKIDIDFKNDRVSLITGKEVYTDSHIHLKPGNNYKLLFGANTYSQYQTTDLPPMKVRDVKILQSNKVISYWPLNECSGNVANDVIYQNNGIVTNPLWYEMRHLKWQLEKELTVSGVASTAFDVSKESIYIITADSLITFLPNQSNAVEKYKHNSAKQQLVPGDQSIYANNKLNYILADKKAVVQYNIENHNWEQRLTDIFLYTNYGHLNKFFSSVDTSLYLIGGYGQLKYKDSVIKYNLTKHSAENVKTQGDFFTPRYLAGLGTTAKGDTAYILGGYGSASGQQIVNPHNLSDMMRFTVKDKTFKKLFELDFKGEDWVFANSLIINSVSKTYYGLVFQQHKYNSHLQLITGSLNNASYKLVGNPIPFLFHDAFSFADIYYCPKSGKFLTITLLKDNDQTHIKIYSLLSPPESLQVNSRLAIINNRFKGWLIGICLAFLILGAFIVYRKRAIKPTAYEALPEKDLQNSPPLIETAELTGEDGHPVKLNPVRNAIFLFGDLHLFTAEGVEITKSFTPLLKELFLIIMLHSINGGRGVSSEKLNEILWFDKSEKSGRNNCSVNIVKLKVLLDKIGHYHISKDTGYWTIEIDYKTIFVDYYHYLTIVSNKDKLNKEKILQLTQITQRGNFLPNIEYEWLDDIKSEVSNEIIDCYLQFADSIKISDDPKFLIKLANDIFHFDPVNEEAMILKCKALSYLGNHSLAKTTYENFNKEYREIYGENFEKNFHAVVE